MKRTLLTLALAAAICGLNAPAQAAGRITIKLASYYGIGHPVSWSVEFFKESLEKDSNGRFEVQHFPNNQLGGEEVFIDHAKRGTIQMAVAGGLTRKDESRLMLVEPPLIIETWKQAYAAYNGPLAEKIKGDYTENTGVFIPGFMVGGFRQISSSRPVTRMEELGKLKLRAPASEVSVKIFQGFGCDPVTLPVSEVYDALESKTLDGQDNPYPAVASNGWWEVQQYVLESRHMFTANPVLLNGTFYGRLSDADKAVLDRNIKAMIAHNWRISEQADHDARQFLLDKGMEIHVPSPEFRRQMKDSLQELYAWFCKSAPGAEEIIAAMERLPK